MKRKFFFAAMVCAGACALIVFVVRSDRSINRANAPPASGPSRSSSMASAPPLAAAAVSLITEPDDGMAPLHAMIQGASKSLDLAIYEIDDPHIEALLAAAAVRGVAVRVLLSPGYEGAPSTVNGEAYEYFEAAGVPVRWAPVYFSLTHEKALVADGDRALIMSFNLVPEYYATSRDFAVDDRDARDASAIESVFDADWRGVKVPTGAGDVGGDGLVWSPDARPALVALIAGAKKSLDVYNEEMADSGIISALAAAAARGVAVRIDMTYSSEWNSAFEKLIAAGVSVRAYAPDASRYIHAKVIVADGTRAFVGSENFSYTSLNLNRELGIVVADGAVAASLARTFDADWQGASALSS